MINKIIDLCIYLKINLNYYTIYTDLYNLEVSIKIF